MPMRLAWIPVGIILGMFCAASLADIFYPDDWRPVEATVLATDIRRTRPGTPQWSLMADVDYDVAGRHYERKGLEVFRDTNFDVSDAERRKWPPGRTLTVYYRVSAPQDISKWEDGGRQAVIVLSGLAVPVMAALGFFIRSLARARTRSQANRSK
jgi:hypothetical protein